jgi:hypothetical protein
MDHFGSAKLMIAFHAQYVKRTKTLIFDRDLPEEEAIQSADHYLENFKVLYCKIKRCEKACPPGIGERDMDCSKVRIG